jgi:hypothetical protein
MRSSASNAAARSAAGAPRNAEQQPLALQRGEHLLGDRAVERPDAHGDVAQHLDLHAAEPAA